MSKMWRIILAASMVFASAAGAEPTVITFEEAVKIALTRNISLMRSQNSEALDRNAVSEARSQYLPDLRFGMSGSENFGRTFDSNQGKLVTETSRSFSTNLSSSLLLFNGFARRANVKAAILDAKAGGHDTERTRQTVVFLVISGYLSMIEADAQRQVAEENLAAERDQESLVRKFVDAGRSPISDLYQQQANVARGDIAVVNAKRNLELARIDLVQILQLDPAGEYTFDAPAIPDSIDPGPQPVLGDLLDQAFRHRPDLNASETRLRSAEQEERRAAGGHWPTLSLSAGYGSGYNSGSEDAFWDQLDSRRSGNLSLGLSFPVFDRFSTNRAVERAKIGSENARLALADQRQTVALEVRRAMLDELSARESLRAALVQLRAAAQALDFTEQRYEAGASTLHEVTLSRADLVGARSSRVSAAYTLLWQKHVRDYYVGVLDPGARLLP